MMSRGATIRHRWSRRTRKMLKKLRGKERRAEGRKAVEREKTEE